LLSFRLHRSPSPLRALLLVLGLLLNLHCASRGPRAREPVATGPANSTGCTAKERRAEAKKTWNGYASYYHDSLAGNRTANGERYNPKALTAAHRTLPFGSRVRVTRREGPPHEVCLTVNDRGPFADTRRRILDVSRRGARALDMVRAGVAKIRLELLED
jgi:rare lipoprotein A